MDSTFSLPQVPTDADLAVIATAPPGIRGTFDDNEHYGNVMLEQRLWVHSNRIQLAMAHFEVGQDRLSSDAYLHLQLGLGQEAVSGGPNDVVQSHSARPRTPS